ncbi:MAG: TrkA family potassium uptake protein, partial [Phormidium sp.]
IIVGSHTLGRLIARIFQERGESAVLIDTDPEACKVAEQENLRVFLSSALDTKVLEDAGLAAAGTFISMTNNGEVNLVLAQRAVEEFSPPRVLAVFPRDPLNPNNSKKIQQAFVPHLQIKTWNEYLNDGKVKLGKTELKEEGFAFQQAHLQALIHSGEFVPLLMERDERLVIVPAAEEWQIGDRIIYLLHDLRPNLLKRLSGATPSSPLTLEKLPKVEEVPIPYPAREPYLEKA